MTESRGSRGLFWSTVTALSAVALLLLCVGFNNSSESITDPRKQRRRAIMYSERATIPPDPDSLVAEDDVKEELAGKYGKWHFWDGDEENRPEDKDLCAEYEPYCDVPGDDFEDEAWQSDAVFVNHILNDADELVSRAMEAIFEEYGHPKPKTAEGLAERMKMFHWDKIDLSTAEEPPDNFKGRGNRGNGGWTTKRSFHGLVRRLLHAIMTNGTFTVVLAGHSSAAGHGNHFRQSYIMQFHKIMAPIFARLGVKLVTRNISQGGLGTLQNAMAAGDLYGRKMDLLLWDSGMTEKPNTDAVDIFFRQGLIGGDYAPVIWSAGGNFDLLKMLHEEADADVGEFGLGLDGIALTTSEEQAQTLPYAVRYMRCDSDNQSVCKQAEPYCAKCWIPREDKIEPEAEQHEHFGSQVSWHPGWRQHQLTGRVIAFSVLEALQMAIQEFSDGTMGGPPLSEDYWHVGDYFKNIQDKVKNLDQSLGKCYGSGGLPDRICNTPIKGRTQYTPRANFDETALNSLIKPTSDGYVPKNDKKALYEGPDMHNTCYDIPEGEVDVLSIVSGRRRRLSTGPFYNKTTTTSLASTVVNRRETKKSAKKHSNHYIVEEGKDEEYPWLEKRELAASKEIVPGKGWELVDEPQGTCDGTYYAVCNRWTHHSCVLGGHHDSRGNIVGNALSGWLVFTLPDVKEGLIMLKLHSWAKGEDLTITKDWETENNERRLEPDPAAKYPDNFRLEYAVNGKVTSLNKAQYIEERKKVQRVVEILTVLDDPKFTDDETEVEVAIRLQDCGRECTIAVSHIYWA